MVLGEEDRGSMVSGEEDKGSHGSDESNATPPIERKLSCRFCDAVFCEDISLQFHMRGSHADEFEPPQFNMEKESLKEQLKPRTKPLEEHVLNEQQNGGANTFDTSQNCLAVEDKLHQKQKTKQQEIRNVNLISTTRPDDIKGAEKPSGKMNSVTAENDRIMLDHAESKRLPPIVRKFPCPFCDAGYFEDISVQFHMRGSHTDEFEPLQFNMEKESPKEQLKPRTKPLEEHVLTGQQNCSANAVDTAQKCLDVEDKLDQKQKTKQQQIMAVEPILLVTPDDLEQEETPTHKSNNVKAENVAPPQDQVSQGGKGNQPFPNLMKTHLEIAEQKDTKDVLEDGDKSRNGSTISNLRTVVIDAANLIYNCGRPHDSDGTKKRRPKKVTKNRLPKEKAKNEPNLKGIQNVIQHFLDRGHNVIAYLPHWAQSKVQMMPELRILKQKGHIDFTPHRKVGKTDVTSSDDLFVLQVAKKTGAVVVTNDQYRDHYKKWPQFRDVIANRLLPYRFVEGQIILPCDPLSEKGPTLEQFLQKDTDLHFVQAEFERRMAPSDIRFTRNRIHSAFNDRKRLVQTFCDMLQKDNLDKWMPRIDCFKASDGHYYVQDGNRRLYLLKILEEEGRLNEVMVNVVLGDQFPCRRKNQTGLQAIGQPGLYDKLKKIWRKHRSSLMSVDSAGQEDNIEDDDLDDLRDGDNDEDVI